jgi:hypothetical protein
MKHVGAWTRPFYMRSFQEPCAETCDDHMFTNSAFKLERIVALMQEPHVMKAFRDRGDRTCTIHLIAK